MPTSRSQWHYPIASHADHKERPASWLDPLPTPMGCGVSQAGDYDLTLHIGAIFIVLAVSLTGMLLPICTARLKGTSASLLVCVAKMFGTGVILSTSVVHMFSSASTHLSNPCLPSFWTAEYPAFAGVFFLSGVLATHCLQIMLTIKMSRNGKRSSIANEEEPLCPHLHGHLRRDNEEQSLHSHMGMNHEHEMADTTAYHPGVSHDTAHNHDDDTSIQNKGSCTSSNDCHHKHVDHHLSLGILDTDDHCGACQCESQYPQARNLQRFNSSSTNDINTHSHGFLLLKERQLSVYLLEVGIFTHSVLVGITLGTSRSEFTSLVIALSFHQFFEGMALSAVLIESNTNLNTFEYANFFYCLTTPIGICIGILVHSTYNDNGITSLLVQGILDALSGGILMYDGLINIVAPHFKSLDFIKSTTYHQMLHLGSLWLGAVLMSVLGKFV